MQFIVFSLGVGLGLGIGLLFHRRYYSSSLRQRWHRQLEENIAAVLETKLEDFYNRITDTLRQELHSQAPELAGSISQPDKPRERRAVKKENKEDSVIVTDNYDSGNSLEVNLLPDRCDIPYNDTAKLEGFLGRRNIAIKHIPPINHTTTDKDIVLDDIALFMGDKYPAIQKLYDRIKSSMNLGHSVCLNLQNEPQAHISAMCQMSQFLYEIAFLEEYRYQKSPKYILSVKPSRIPEALNFFAGRWLERYMKAKFVRLLQEQLGTEQYSFLMNPQIILPNGDDFELDLLLEINETIYWFEGKTGNYQKHIEKYARMLPILGLDADHAFILLPDISTETARTLTAIFHLTALNLPDFQDTLVRIIARHGHSVTADAEDN
ncbi:MAG: hypothetical protein ACK421_12675 [Pseudanabaenaceae cyanobacterium]